MKEKKKFLEPEEFKRLLDVAKKVNIRDYVLFLLAGNLGLRVGEVVRLRKSDFDFGTKTVMAPTLKQKTKGPLGKEELPVVYIELPGIHIMNNEVFKKYFKVLGSGWLFKGKRSSSRISENSVQKIFKKYVKALKIEVSFHSLRHFRGDSIYKKTFDLMAVKTSLRHKSMKYASTYVHPGLKEITRYFDKGGFVE